MQGQYPNFQPMMQPQYPPMYGQQFTPVPPYNMDRLINLQNMQQSLQQPQQTQQQIPALNGRVVESIENIVASDVPMDGTFAVFPKRDMSEIAVKYWTGDGKIATISFKPDLDHQGNTCPDNSQKVQFDEINDLLGGLLQKVDSMSNKIDDVLKSKSNIQRSKKEVGLNEHQHRS